MAPLLTKNFALLEEEVVKHVEEDRVVQAVYWNGSTGCFIGCLSHSGDTLKIEEKYGLPVMVQRIAESIFEDLPAKESVAFFAAFPEAVACDGKDLSRVGWQFMAAELRSLPTQSAVTARIIAGLDLLANDTEWADRAAVNAAANAAVNAADSAAARAAARAADSAAAIAAASAAYSAAWAAVNAAASAAAIAAASAADMAAARRRQRDLLLQLIKDAPVF